MRYQSGILPTDYGFTHQRADAATGLDDYGARSYDPVAGQFTSADTTLAGGLNRYAYVAGNPETLVDPTGAYAQACDTSQCPGGGGLNTYLPVGADGTDSGEGGGVTTSTPPKVNSAPTGGGLTSGGAITLAVVFGIIAVGIAAQLGATASQGIWHAWSVWQAEHPAPGSPGRTDTTSGSGPSYTRSQTNGLDAVQAASGGNGGSGGSGTVPRTPPPTENGEAIGLGAPIISEDVLAECDPQLPTAQYCIGYTRFTFHGEKPALPPLPDGAQNLSDFGHRIIQWGRGDADALARIGNLSADDLRAEGMTPELAGQWRDFYVAVKARNPGNPSAGGRAALMDWIYQLLSSGG